MSTKITLTFDDRIEAEKALRAADAFAALWEFRQWMRSELKYKEEPATLEAARQHFWELLRESDLARLMEL
jgi:hypothetical protein